MTYEIEDVVLRQRVRDILQLLRDQIVVDGNRAGWHNAFRGNRIGTSGSALPLRFFLAAGEDVPHLEGILEVLRAPQLNSEEQAAWSILSLGPEPNIEGTVWPMLALHELGDPGDADLVARAAAWVTETQDESGGWASDLQNSPRLTLTTASVTVLTRVCGARGPALDRAEAWLRASQRAENGSWGPTPEESGTPQHTSLACIALLELGVSPSDQAIQRGREFLIENWKPHPKAIHTESYDVHQHDGNYQRCLLEHDPDALTIQALLSIRGSGDMARAISAAGKLFAVETDGLEVERTTLWNLLPRGFLALELLTMMPLAGGRLLARPGATAVIEEGARRPSVSLARFWWREFPLTPRDPLRLVYAALFALLLLMTVLLFFDVVKVGEYLASVVFAALLTVVSVLLGRRGG